MRKNRTFFPRPRNPNVQGLKLFFYFLFSHFNFWQHFNFRQHLLCEVRAKRAGWRCMSFHKFLVINFYTKDCFHVSCAVISCEQEILMAVFSFLLRCGPCSSIAPYNAGGKNLARLRDAALLLPPSCDLPPAISGERGPVHIVWVPHKNLRRGNCAFWFRFWTFAVVRFPSNLSLTPCASDHALFPVTKDRK